MVFFRSYRAKLQGVFLLLGSVAIALTGWESSAGATAALRQATYERLTAIRQTRCRQVERYFQDLGTHVLALSSDEAAMRALEEFRAAWPSLPQAEVAAQGKLRGHYRQLGTKANEWFPEDRRTVTLQDWFIATNPHPAGAKDRMLEAPGPYGEVHARYHPTFHRYQSAFGLYDIFLVDATDQRVLYTVSKEIDLGVRLGEHPYRSSALGEVFEKAMAISEPEQFVLRDYEPYLPSDSAPAAFVAAPVWRAGGKTGVLVMQVSIQEVNRVMTADENWQSEGLGRTGQAYIVGPDNMLRSDMRRRIEQPEQYSAELLRAGTPPDVVDEVKRHGTAVLRLPVAPEAARNRAAAAGTGSGVDALGTPVLRSHARLNVPGLDWSVMAEIEEQEAFAPVRSLRNRILGIGTLIAAGFWLAAAWMARSVTRPVLALAEGAERLGHRDFSTRLPVSSVDEIGQLAASFNRMAEKLEQTTVSKEELERLAGRLITAQEDERSRIARELHDDLTQRLAVVAIEAGRLEQSPEGQREGLARIKQQMAQLSDTVHGMSRSLHPAMLDDLGLTAAIEAECRAFFERGGAPVDVETDGHCDGLQKATQLALYRIVQEGLRNVQKHAEAERVQIQLQRTADEVHLSIRDNGRGFNRADPAWRAGLGLASMEERARWLGGRFAVESAPREGTRIDVWLPLLQAA